MRFFRPTYDKFSSERKAKIHASQDGLKTVCGRTIDSLWEETDRFEWGICKRCERIMPRIKKSGKQLRLDS